MAERSINKYKHMRFGSAKAQRFFKTLSKEDKKSTATGLLKSAFKRVDAQVIEKMACESTNEPVKTPNILPVTKDCASRKVSEIFCLKEIVPKSTRHSIKAFAAEFYTAFDEINDYVETVKQNILKVDERFLFRSEYYNRRAVELIEKAFRDQTAVSSATLGYYYLLATMTLFMKMNFKDFRKGEDPLDLYGKVTYDAADYIYQSFCSQEMQAKTGKLCNEFSREDKDKLLLHLIIITILVQNLRSEAPNYTLLDAADLFNELGVKNYKVASLCEKVGLGVQFDSARPEKISVYIKAPLVVQVEKSYGKRRR